jgi:hypothetical protein
VETLIAFVKSTITEEDTLLRTKFKLSIIVWPKVRPTRTTKNFKEHIIREFLEQELKGCLHIEKPSWSSIDQKTRSGKSITPKEKRHRCMSKKCEASFNDVAVLALNRTVLLMCMWARNAMRNPKFAKEGVEVAIFATLIRLNMNNLVAKESLDMKLKLHKHIKHISFAFK